MFNSGKTYKTKNGLIKAIKIAGLQFEDYRILSNLPEDGTMFKTNVPTVFVALLKKAAS